jgi:hypothetical protein
MSTLGSRWLRSTAIAGLGAVFFAGVSALPAETLTGVVRQPKAPYGPAADSTVTVYNFKTSARIGDPTTTTPDGKYAFKIEKDLTVRIEAVWDAQASMPGTSIAKVSKNPTEVNIQLQPPRPAADNDWYQSGVQTAKNGSWSAVATATALQSAQVGAVSRYQFILGAKSIDASGFQGIDQMAMFDPRNSEAVTKGLRIAESQFKKSKTLPTFAQLGDGVHKDLQPDLYSQLIGFLAPNDNAGREEWKKALDAATGTNSDSTIYWANKFGESDIRARDFPTHKDRTM